MIKRSRPKIDRQGQDKKPQGAVPDDGKSQVSSDTNPVAKAESRNEPTDRAPAGPHEQGGRPRCAWRSFTTIDDDWTRRDRQRGRLKDALLSDGEEAVAEPKYEPDDHEREVLAKQAERLKNQVRVPRMKFVEDQRGGRLEFDHPDQAVASALLNEAFGTADDQFTKGLLGHLCAALPIDENSAFEFPRPDDLNSAISLIAAAKPVDGLHAEIFASVAICRITRERLLHNVGGPIRVYLSKELRLALQYKDNPKGEVNIDNRPVLEFSIREANKLMKLEVDLISAANRHRAAFESSRMKQQQLVAVAPEASLPEIRPAIRPDKANGAGSRRFNGSAIHKLPEKTDWLDLSAFLTPKSDQRGLIITHDAIG